MKFTEYLKENMSDISGENNDVFEPTSFDEIQFLVNQINPDDYDELALVLTDFLVDDNIDDIDDIDDIDESVSRRFTNKKKGIRYQTKTASQLKREKAKNRIKNIRNRVKNKLYKNKNKAKIKSYQKTYNKAIDKGLHKKKIRRGAKKD